MKIEAEEIAFSGEDRTNTDALITSENIPQRIAATTAGLIVKDFKHGRSVFLCNPHPDSWKTWMFPYGSRTAATPDKFRAGMTVSDVIQSLSECWRDNPALKADALAEVTALAGCSGSRSTLVHRDYALRYSKSALCWSAYEFEYYLLEVCDPAPAPTLQHAWLPLKDDISSSLSELSAKSGLVIAANVREFLSHHQCLLQRSTS